jgi:hypothetical protein
MPIFQLIVIILGLVIFEVISSIDNAVVNADVLHTMTARGRKWFLFYGIFIAVFLVRGLLPLLIVYFSNPSVGLVAAFTATFSGHESTAAIIEASKPILLAGGGIYLVFLFFHWLFLEKKEYAFFLERHIHTKLFFWFYAIVSVILLVIVWTTIKINPLISLGAVVGSTAFFITNGFKHNAEQMEQDLKTAHLSDFAKILYLELIDATFSIDGVLGAFAFTISVPLILLGNGIGAVVVRYVTVRGTATVKKYRFLKNGAMYSILSLGVIMVLESLAVHVYTLLPPVITVVVVGVFFLLSRKELKMREGRA